MPQKAWSAKRERQYEHIKGLEEVASLGGGGGLHQASLQNSRARLP